MPTGEEELYEIEVLDGELVPVPAGALEPAAGDRLALWIAQPGVQAAVVAATGFVAGAATMALLRRYGQSRLERAAAGQALETPRLREVRTYVVSVRRLG